MTNTGRSRNERCQADLRELLSIGTLSAVRAGCALTTEGTPGRDAFFVVEGTARVTIDGRLVAHLGPDQFIGEMALIDHGPRSASVVAESPMQVLTFDARTFSGLLDDPRLSREVQRQLVGRLRAALLATPKNQPNNWRNQP